MSRLNYSHLLYFYTIVKEGGVGRAADALSLSPQTISGQLSTFESTIGYPLFDRKGKKLILNSEGQRIYSYAEKIFALGLELEGVLERSRSLSPPEFNVGITDVVPKSLISTLIKTSLNPQQQVKLVCREGGLETLLDAMDMNELDIIISDHEMSPELKTSALSYPLGRTGISFIATHELSKELSEGFPGSLHNAPFLLPGHHSAQRINLLSWFEKLGIKPNILAEFDDMALMQSFAESGFGIFGTPTVIEESVLGRYNMSLAGRTTEIEEHFFAIVPKRLEPNPYASALTAQASTLFSKSSS